MTSTWARSGLGPRLAACSRDSGRVEASSSSPRATRSVEPTARGFGGDPARCRWGWATRSTSSRLSPGKELPRWPQRTSIRWRREIPRAYAQRPAAWARRQAQTDIQVAAARVAAEREVLGRTRVELRDRIVGYQTLVEPSPPDEQLASAPYKGLAPFGSMTRQSSLAASSWWAGLPAASPKARCSLLVGPSGSGKSSLARAGLMSALSAGLLPGSDRVAASDDRRRPPRLRRSLDAALDELADPTVGGKSTHQLVLIDQLEQIFSRCDHTGHGQSFLDRLADFAADPARTTAVVATLRSDYFGRLSDSPTFAAAAADASEVIGPMTAEELQRAIELPAQRAGLRLESGLAAAIAADAHGKPGALPLLSTALLELWEQRNGSTLTWAAYRRSGGLAGAVAGSPRTPTADSPATSRRWRGRILLRTVGAGEDMREVSRRVPLARARG